jgi:hypothetical protein
MVTIGSIFGLSLAAELTKISAALSAPDADFS